MAGNCLGRIVDKWYKHVPDSLQPAAQLMVGSIIANYEEEHGEGSWKIPDVKFARAMKAAGESEGG
jgi:hypothetical protein